MNITVFISYSQDNTNRKLAALSFAQRLRDDGIESSIDQFVSHPIEGWPKWMENQLREAKFVLVCPSERYKADFEQVGRNASGGRYESSMISTSFYYAGASYSRIAVVLLEEGDQEFIPQPLKSGTYYKVYQKEGYTSLYRWLTNQPAVVPKDVGNVRKLHGGYGVEDFDPNKGSHFIDLCKLIEPLMKENKRIFDQFGPNSNLGDARPLRTNFEVWEDKKLKKIVPNNELIARHIRTYYNIIPEISRSLFDRWLSHIDAFETHVSKGGIWYQDSQFPCEVEQIVETQIRDDFLSSKKI